jgi:acyl transferase domain-containing protein
MTRDRSLDIAVTGIAARFPGPEGLPEWWAALKAGRVLTTRYDPAAQRAAGVPDALLEDPGYVPVRGHLEGVDRFEAELFRIAPRDAELTDPQHRMMLEISWAALEDAGIDPLGPDKPVTAVFASSLTGGGFLRRLVSGGPLDPGTLEQVIHGNEPDFAASRIAYKLGLRGPALSVQTACSSSLVGVHLAVQSLLNGDCDQAIVVAAGVDHPQPGHVHSPGGVHSASGVCRPFDAGADGVVAGSGVAAVVLRRLDDALEDGPEPYGVVLGSAINNDGAAKAGYYAPAAAGQTAVIQAALSAADVPGESVGYLETHGTGTPIGDPIEWSAASGAYRALGARPGQIAVGALKANVGHLDAAAGLAALIKALLVVRSGEVPPIAGFTALNPLLAGEESPLYVPGAARRWQGPEPRRAGVSAFGIGGTNAHVLVEQPPGVEGTVRPRPRSADERHLLLVSANDPAALERTATRLARHLGEQEPDPADAAHTLAVGRAALPERLAVPARDGAEAASLIARAVRPDPAVQGETEYARGRVPATGPAPVALVFPGQGTQQPGMALGFAAALPGFASALDECLAAFEPELGGRLRAALTDFAFPAEQLARTELAQPALFALEHAVASALAGLGVRPAVVLGHSLGEITAACAAGVLDLGSAAALVTARGRGMQDCPPGAMLALGCPEQEGLALLAEAALPLELAAVNSPEGCVLAGTSAALDAFESSLGGRIWSRRLRSDRAFHSVLIEPAATRLRPAVYGATLRPSTLPWASGVTGEVFAPGTRPDPEYFLDQARRPVRFADALAAAAARLPGLVVVEAGPGRVLSAFAEAQGLSAVPLSPARGQDRTGASVLGALGALWTLGHDGIRDAVGGTGRLIHLPGYSFAGPEWIAPEIAGDARPEVRGPDRAPVPQPASAAGTGRAPSDQPPEAVLAGLWSQVLGHGELTGESDFFDLGGDSLAVTTLARGLRQSLGVLVPTRDLMAGRTLAGQTAAVRDALVSAGRAR